MLLHAAHAADHGAPIVDCDHEVSRQWFGSRCHIDTQLIFHTGIQHSTRYTYTPQPLDEDLIGEEVYSALRHAFSGCSSTSAFTGRG